MVEIHNTLKIISFPFHPTYLLISCTLLLFCFKETSVRPLNLCYLNLSFLPAAHQPFLYFYHFSASFRSVRATDSRVHTRSEHLLSEFLSNTLRCTICSSLHSFLSDHVVSVMLRFNCVLKPSRKRRELNIETGSYFITN